MVRRRLGALLGIVALTSCIAGAYYFRNQLWLPTTVLRLPAIVEEQEIRLASKIGGRVQEILVAEGDLVKQGQLLARLEAPEIEARLAQMQASLRGAEAKLEEACNGPLPEQIQSAQASVAIAEASLANLRKGNRTEEIAQARLEVEVRSSEELRAKRERDRLSGLLPTQAISASDMELAQTIWRNAEGQLSIAKERLRLLELGHREEVIAEGEARLRQMQANLALLERGTRRESIRQLEAMRDEIQAKVQELEILWNEATIEAPRDCVVEVLPVRVGDMVQANQPIVRVRCHEDLWIKAYIPETELARIRLNQKVEILHDGSRTSLPGKVIFVASASEFTPRNVQSVTERQHQLFAIKVRPDRDMGIFKSGMAAEVLVPLHSTSDGPP